MKMYLLHRAGCFGEFHDLKIPLRNHFTLRIGFNDIQVAIKTNRP